MKVKMGEVYAAGQALQALLQTKQPPGTAFQLMSLAEALGAKLAPFDRQRLAWIAELGTIDKATGEKSCAPGSSGWPEFAKRFEAVMQEDVELPGAKPIAFEKFGDAPIAGESLLKLGPFLAKPKEAGQQEARKAGQRRRRDAPDAG